MPAGHQPCAMHNGALAETAALRVSPLGEGFLFGAGLFETVAVRDGRPVFFSDHHARLNASAAMLHATPVTPHETLLGRCHQVIAANHLAEGSLKILFFEDGGTWSELILARANSYPAAAFEKGFRLLTVASGLRDGPLHGIKSLNYLGNLQAKRAAQAAGFDEPVFVDPRGRILEGATTNVFVVKAGKAWTPPLSAGILPGVMRARVLKLCGEIRLDEQDLALGDLRGADEVFVTNALLGIMPVVQVDTVAFDPGRNPVTRALRARVAAQEA